MIIYLDVGVFVDYLSNRYTHASGLRTENRKTRDVATLQADASRLFELLKGVHLGVTSTLTFSELENVIFERVKKQGAGMENNSKQAVQLSRPIVLQLLAIGSYFELKFLPLEEEVVKVLMTSSLLGDHGIRANDALHLTTAICSNVDAFITTDEQLCKLDGHLHSRSGKPIRCWDTDEAITNL